LFTKSIAVAMAGFMVMVAPLSEAQQSVTNSQTSPATPVISATPNVPPSQASQAPPKPNSLLDGTPVKLRLGRTLSSADAKTGDEVDFDVLEDVKVNDVLVISKGALALATVTEAEHKKNMGRGGKLDVNIDSVRLVDNEKVALRATEGGKAGGHVGAMTGAMVATSIVFFPAAPLFLFMHGKDMTIPKGTEITAYVNGDMTLDMSKFVPASAAVIPQGIVSSQVSVDSNVANCDIEVDGVFVGSTPSQLSVTSGKHEIAVTKKGYATWSRTLTIAGSNVHLNAELEADQSNGK
jgi:hypothetical protein